MLTSKWFWRVICGLVAVFFLASLNWKGEVGPVLGAGLLVIVGLITPVLGVGYFIRKWESRKQAQKELDSTLKAENEQANRETRAIVRALNGEDDELLQAIKKAGMLEEIQQAYDKAISAAKPNWSAGEIR